MTDLWTPEQHDQHCPARQGGECIHEEGCKASSAATSQDILLREYQAEIKRLREAYERVRAQRDEALAQAERANHLAWPVKPNQGTVRFRSAGGDQAAATTEPVGGLSMGDMADHTGDRAFDEWNEGHSEDGELPEGFIRGKRGVQRKEYQTEEIPRPAPGDLRRVDLEQPCSSTSASPGHSTGVRIW